MWMRLVLVPQRKDSATLCISVNRMVEGVFKRNKGNILVRWCGAKQGTVIESTWRAWAFRNVQRHGGNDLYWQCQTDCKRIYWPEQTCQVYCNFLQTYVRCFLNYVESETQVNKDWHFIFHDKVDCTSPVPPRQVDLHCYPLPPSVERLPFSGRNRLQRLTKNHRYLPSRPVVDSICLAVSDFFSVWPGSFGTPLVLDASEQIASLALFPPKKAINRLTRSMRLSNLFLQMWELSMRCLRWIERGNSGDAEGYVEFVWIVW